MSSSNAPTICFITRFTFFPNKKQSWCAKAKCGSLYDDPALKIAFFSNPNALISTTFKIEIQKNNVVSISAAFYVYLQVTYWLWGIVLVGSRVKPNWILLLWNSSWNTYRTEISLLSAMGNCTGIKIAWTETCIFRILYQVDTKTTHLCFFEFSDAVNFNCGQHLLLTIDCSYLLLVSLMVWNCLINKQVLVNLDKFWKNVINYWFCMYYKWTSWSGQLLRWSH